MELIKLYIFSQKLALMIISGGTERQILKNVDNIVKTAFPLDKVSGYYQESKINVVDRKRSWNILSSSSKERK